MRRTTLALLLLPLMAGCATAVPTPAPQQGTAPVVRPRPQPAVPPTVPAPPVDAEARAPRVLRAPGLEGVIERDAGALVHLFGPPRLDVREGDMRKLQFSGEACVLDVFLYPLRKGAEPVATYLEARRGSDGQDVDRAACVQALRR